MTTGYWQINGVNLTDANVTVQPNKLTAAQKVRQAKSDIHQGTQHRERLGKDLPTISIEIRLLGQGDQKFTQLAFIQGIAEDSDVWTLTAPSGYSVFAYKNYKRVALSADEITIDLQKALGVIVININATVDGIWIADGGDFCQQTYGNFTLLGPTTYQRDDGVITGTIPTVELPEQTLGYPLFVRSATYTMGIPNAISVRTDVDGRIYKTYDLTGFLVPAPAAMGDTGVYEGCSSPSGAFLGTGSMPACTGFSADLLTGDVPFGLFTTAITTENFSKTIGPVYANASTRSESFVKATAVLLTESSSRTESFAKEQPSETPGNTSSRSESFTVTNS